MRITQWGEYGLHCSLQIARREGEGAATVGAAEIADEQGIALEYAQQILQRLRRGSIIESVRGPHGGYKLSRPAKEISVGQVLTAAEGDTFEVMCDTKPLQLERCQPGSGCNLRALWHELRDHVNQFMNARTLQDLLSLPQYAQADVKPVQLPRSGNSSSPA